MLISFCFSATWRLEGFEQGYIAAYKEHELKSEIPSAWEVEEKPHLQDVNKCKHTVQVSLLSLVSGTSQCHETQQRQPEGRTLFKGGTGVRSTWATTYGKTQIQSSSIIILWLISGGKKELFLYLHMSIYIYTNKHFWGKEDPGVLLRPHFKYCWREDRHYPREKAFCFSRILKGRQCELPILSSLNCFGGTGRVSAEGSVQLFLEKYFHIYPTCPGSFKRVHDISVSTSTSP